RFNFQLQAAEIQYEKEKQAIQYERTQVFGLASGIIIILIIITTAWYVISRRRAAYQQKLLDMVTAQNAQLEDRVAERTKELIDKNAELGRLSRYKEELTHMIAHDLKNPLNIILGLSDDPKWGRKAQSMREAGQTMLQMVTNMLDVQKFEEAQMQLESSHIRLVDLATKASGQVDLLLQAKSLVLHNQVNKNWVVFADESLLMRIFLNLFTNAIKYSNLGGSITVEATAGADGWVSVTVADQGQGMDDNSRRHVFDKYFQIKARKSGKIRSTGLGLTFCQLAVEAHGGSIEVASAPEQGTQFTFTLPQGDVNSCKLEDPEVRPTAVSHHLPVLSAADWQQLGDLPERLRNTPLYEAGIIRALLQEIPEDAAPFKEWKEALIQAALHWNESRYQQLLSREPTPSKTD
ncbi:MAG: HAMP domain-containing sensor histidine kinase, partial [Bacteroidota bacterium]